MTKVGECRLCQRNGQELQRSHFLPASIYRTVRDETEENPNPIRFGDGGVFQDSKQIADYLLCRECEARLNENGERWFLANCWRKHEFRLVSLLTAESPAEITQQIEIYHGSAISSINAEALTYFASSLFWRSAAHDRKMFVKSIRLGPYEEQFRRYLAGEARLPNDCVLWVSVPNTISPFVNLTLTPYGGRKGSYHIYKLIVLGVGFHLFVGRQIPEQYQATCFVRGKGNPIHMTDLLEKAVTQDIDHKFRLQPELLNGPKSKWRTIATRMS